MTVIFFKILKKNQNTFFKYRHMVPFENTKENLPKLKQLFKRKHVKPPLMRTKKIF